MRSSIPIALLLIWISIFLAIAETWQSYDKNGRIKKLKSLDIDSLEPSTNRDHLVSGSTHKLFTLEAITSTANCVRYLKTSTAVFSVNPGASGNKL